MIKKFAMVGPSGFVAPRHMKAIKETGNKLVAAFDPCDSVGILDRYFPDCKFFTEFERFDRHLDKFLRKGQGIDYLSICSPNYLHDAHCRFGLRLGADVICEKPLVINEWNLDPLKEIEEEYNKKIYTVLQLRYHPELIKVKKTLKDFRHNVKIKYVTPRGSWYIYSWKSNYEKSGGLLLNIGIHLFDLMIWLFGEDIHTDILLSKKNKVSGETEFEKAIVSWFLSIDHNDTPDKTNNSFRLIEIDGKPLRFDNVFTDLHIDVYKDILSGGGYGIEDARYAIKFLNKLRRPYEI